MSLEPYKQALKSAEADLAKKLASGNMSFKEFAIARSAVIGMSNQLKNYPNSVKNFDTITADPILNIRGPSYWKLYWWRKANRDLYPHQANITAYKMYLSKISEIARYWKILESRVLHGVSVQIDKKGGKSFLIKDNPLTRKVLSKVESECSKWLVEYPVDRNFYMLSEKTIIAIFMSERPDMQVMFRLAQKLPLDVEISNAPINRPSAVVVTELAISIIPIVGNLVTAYEVYAGKDLFGYKLTSLERAILAASILLPLAGRLVKYGKAIYSQSRLVAMYGGDVISWSKAIRTSGKSRILSSKLGTIKKAEQFVRSQNPLPMSVAKNADDAITAIAKARATVAMKSNPVATKLFRKLSSKIPELRMIDDLALQRVLEKGPNISHLKGQMLEEIMESQLVPNLQKAHASLALGLNSGRKKLIFIPGHLIRDPNSRQITDGILATVDNDVLEIAAIFEAKAGRYAARELSLARGSITKLTKGQKSELRAYAKDILRDKKQLAMEQGLSYNKSINQIEKELIQHELGGQVRRDIERLSIHGQLRIGSHMVKIRFSPTKTKFFGVLPKDVNKSLIEKELSTAKVSFEILGVDITQRQLNKVANQLKSTAMDFANKL